MRSPDDTIAAIATPLGEGGIGVIRLSGPHATSITQKIFRKTKSSSPAGSGVPHPLRPNGGGLSPGRVGDMGSMDPPPATVGDDVVKTSPQCFVGYIYKGSEVIDQVVLTMFRSPHSYTGQDVVEISAHGSPLILNSILSLCAEEGARLAEPGEFTERAFLNGKIDLTQAEAVAELIRAKTDKTLIAAKAQLGGSLAAAVRGLRDRLMPLLAHVEVGLDHADEDHDFLERAKLEEHCDALTREIDALLESARVSKVLRQGYRVALMGRPNVGKSSLMNALLKEDRAIVTPIAGTTRDTLEETLTIRGIPVVLTDTAGLRANSQDPVEALGIARTRATLQQADLALVLLDGSQPFSVEDAAVLNEASDRPYLVVMNKADLPASLTADTLPMNAGGRALSVSAVTGSGIPALLAAISDRALLEKANAGEARWLLNARHTHALERARESLELALGAARGKQPEECVALELKSALDALGEIIGETTTEDLLGEIFSQFCVGK